METNIPNPDEPIQQTSAEFMVGSRLRRFRTKLGLSLRSLADRSGLNVNTLSLIENAKSSPSVSTLQQLSQALKVPLSAFFESEPLNKHVVFTPADQRPQVTFGSTQMQNLAKDLSGSVVQPFMVIIKPGMGSGDHMIVHTGYEFVYCLSGEIHYKIEQEAYILHPGDSLAFEAPLSHCWENKSDEVSQILLVLYSSDGREEPGGGHFSPQILKKEINMKIAFVTEDGKTISQHFGRAPYYLVLTIEKGSVVNREMREKMGHNQFITGSHAEETHGTGHGMDPSSHNKHVGMAQTISDCEALICGGMGMGAYESMRSLKITPVVTDLLDIDAATQAFIDGKLVDHVELLH